MTEEELDRFAPVLRECDRSCAMIAEDEAAAGPHGGGGLLPADPLPVQEPSESTVVAAV